MAVLISQNTVDFKENKRSLHSYSRTEENARFANGVRNDEIKDDEIRKDYVDPEIVLSLRPILFSGTGRSNFWNGKIRRACGRSFSCLPRRVAGAGIQAGRGFPPDHTYNGHSRCPAT